MSLTFRTAIKDDHLMLTDIAQASKSHWDYPACWLEIWRDGLTITPQLIDKWAIIVAEDDGQPIGFFAIIDLGKTSILEHFWLLPEHIGKGYGRQMLNQLKATAHTMQIEQLVIDSDPQAEPFYLHCGATPTGLAISLLEGTVRTLPIMTLKI
ncbi:MAG: GNAT family N-acetyltransferase [Calditrichia bacterium]